MFGFIGRVLIFVIPLVAWVYLNRKLDRIEDRAESCKNHRFWGKLWFAYGWMFGTKKLGVYIRYILTGALLFWLARWFFLATSTTP